MLKLKSIVRSINIKGIVLLSCKSGFVSYPKNNTGTGNYL